VIDALPIDVRQVLDRMPAVRDANIVGSWAMGIAKTGQDVFDAVLRERNTEAREAASRLAAASIRLVEYLNQDWP